MTQVSVVWTKRTIGNSCLEYVEVSKLCIGVRSTCIRRCRQQYVEVSVVSWGVHIVHRFSWYAMVSIVYAKVCVVMTCMKRCP